MQNSCLPYAPASAARHAGSRAARVLLIADVRLYREGMANSFSGHANFSVIAMAASAEEALALAALHHPDVAIIDMATRHALDIVRGLACDDPELLIVGFGVDEVVGEILACAEAGLAGYVPSDASLDDLLRRIERVCQGELLCTPQIAAGLFRRLAGRRAGGRTADEDRLVLPDLTPREQQVLKLIDRGLSNKRIATALGIEVSTVKNHVHNLLDKLNVSTRAQAAARMGTALPPRHRSYHQAAE